MKCPNKNCSFTSTNAIGLDIHISACSRRSERRVSRLSRRRSVGNLIPKRFGGSASRVASDNVQQHVLHDPTLTELQYSPQHPTMNQAEISLVNEDGRISTDQRENGKACDEASNRLATVLLRTVAMIGESNVTNIMDILLEDAFSLSDFRSRFQSAADCKAYIDKQFDSDMSALGFAKKTIDDEEKNLECTFFHRDPVAVLQQQISQVSMKSMSIKPRIDIDRCGEECFSHPTSAELGRKAVPAVETAIKKSSSSDVFWREKESGSQSFVSLGQIYSDKTQTSLRANGLALYPVHVTLLNYQEQDRRKFISCGQCTVAFLPVDFVNTNSQVAYLRVCIWNASFIALCKAKDMLGLKYGSLSKFGCHRCYAENSKMSEPLKAPSRNMTTTRQCRNESKLLRISSDVQGRKKKALECLESHSLADYCSFLNEFPFSDIHPLLDIHNIFSYDILHNTYLGVSKLLKEMISKRLMDDTLKTKILNSRNEAKSFLETRSDLLNGINNILACIEKESHMKGLRIDFSTAGKGYRYNGLFKQEGLIGMLQARDHGSVDQVMPFIAMFLDRYCGEVKTTALFVHYADMVNQMISKGVDPVWNESKIRKLEVSIADFRRKAKELYSKYQPSEMGTPKMHLLDHVGSDIRRYGGLQYGDSSYFERSHVSAKAHCRGTSQRRSSVMDETVRNFERNVLYQSLQSSVEEGKQGTKKGARLATFNDDIVTLVHRGKRFTYYDLKETYLRKREEQKGNKRKLSGLSNHVLAFLEDVGMVACRMMINLLKEKFCVGRPHEIMHLTIEQVVSGFVNGGFLPTNDDVLKVGDNLMIKFRETRRKVSQRFISTNAYYNHRIKHDCVLIESDSIVRKKRTATRVLWAVKVLGLFRIKELDADESEYAFIQYFDVVESTSEEMRALGCVNLKFSASNRSDDHGGSFQGWYDIVPTSSIRGVVQIVTVDYGIRNLCRESAWYDKIYHINRFYHAPDEIVL